MEQKKTIRQYIGERRLESREQYIRRHAVGREEQHRRKRATWLWRKAVADFVNILLRKKVWLV